jgi:hypothetical protein
LRFPCSYRFMRPHSGQHRPQIVGPPPTSRQTTFPLSLQRSTPSTLSGAVSSNQNPTHHHGRAAVQGPTPSQPTHPKSKIQNPKSPPLPSWQSFPTPAATFPPFQPPPPHPRSPQPPLIQPHPHAGPSAYPSLCCFAPSETVHPHPPALACRRLAFQGRPMTTA